MENKENIKKINSRCMYNIVVKMPRAWRYGKRDKKNICGYWMTLEEWDDIHNYSINEKFEDSNHQIEQKSK